MIKLQTRLSLSLFGLLIVVFIVVAAGVVLLAYSYVKHSYAGEFKNESIAITHLWQEHFDEEDFARTMKEFALSMKAKIQIFGDDNTLLFETDNDGDFSSYESEKARLMIERATSGEVTSDYGFAQAFRSGYIYLAYPVDGYGAKAVLVIYELHDFKELVIDFGYRLLGLFFLALIAFYLFSRYFAGRILNFLFIANEAAKKIANGDYSKRIEMQSRDELEEFTNNFNKLAEAVESRIITINQQKSELAYYAQRQEEFTANAAHELKTPLSSIRLSGELLQLRLEDVENSRLADNIVNASIRLDQTVKALLELAKLENKHALNSLQLQTIDIVATVKDVASNLLQIYSDKNLQIVYDVSCNNLSLVTVPELLLHAINNLVDNAGKYCEFGGQIRIKITIEDSKVNMMIANTGESISLQDIPHIFDRFYRTDKSHSSQIPGSGLGLAITKRIVEVLGGKITVNSGNSWTEFTMSLPIDLSI